MVITAHETAKLLWFEVPPTLEDLRIPALDDNSIHLWHASAAAHGSLLQHFSTLLSSEENDRQARFHFEDARHNFAFARGMLRSLLGVYLGTDARRVRFQYSKHGKPSLADSHREPELQFNLSHTQGAVLLAICRQRAVGVDIERVREDFNPLEIAARFFSFSEQRALTSLPEAEQRQAFFRCWTRKEAFLKARGDGLSFPLQSFDVSIGAGEKEVLLTTPRDLEEAQRWQILPVNVPAGCSAAVAVAQQSSEAR